MNKSLQVQEVLNLALWVAGAGHFVALIAGSQVPSRLHWKSELTKLSPFNRKLLWTYWAFTGLTIAAFGTLTFILHEELLAGGRTALAVAAFIALYWTSRISVDFFYYSHRDWPKGAQFLLGHILLTGLFLFLAATYVTLLVWHLW